MPRITPFMDSHCHLDIAWQMHPECRSWLKSVCCVPVSWSFALEIREASDLAHYFSAQRRLLDEIRAQGQTCWQLCGIHPRNIPADLRIHHVRDLLLPLLDDEHCLGIGEIGLETGSAHEEDILCAQLELGPELTAQNLVFGVHTPRQNKESVTARLLHVLSGFSGLQEHLVVDHCTPATIGGIIEQGYRAGITLSPEKTSPEEVADILSRWPEHHGRLMLNTDSGTRFHEDLQRFVAREDIAPRDRERLARDNAAEFYGLTPDLRSRQ